MNSKNLKNVYVWTYLLKSAQVENHVIQDATSVREGGDGRPKVFATLFALAHESKVFLCAG
jgi:hypothetical protein